ncbi:RWP-RK domain-containing protein [Baffinella frigidus]|nr:RWP-RK domain-containing protein [Cryptophyta sp. CCMP2293]|mmetsp:Transcript_4477/g.9781  ORF Transcript_4477/g.9781 Transcript_4477/m.9781 type:complete len:489 (+) Transcript_4477:119-1585(+)|eukprot:CAMPEP_0180134512 /NCGR_PEP_ID=MMETSP0986-20121125/10211_1 /TAXON_ID=697907 /ORGANISM="non described non described, Strain CCMP2293" /LENGTH=488 /DNA_ID=CAMNT_0022074897 /DNA_START=94 /DNA_END=1560 /DNA_ORIENTATION=+
MVERGAHGGAGGGVSGDGEAGQRRQNVAVTGQSLREHFHLPLHTVAQKLGMCTTAFKKMCRRLGISKWPHRQLRGIDKRIAALKAEINYATTSDRQQFIAGLAALEAEKALLAQGIVGSVGDGSDSDHGESAEPASPRPEDKDGTGQDTPPQKHASMDIDEQSDCDSEGEEVVETRTADGHGAAGIAITERELRQHFHLPLHTAAQKFGICTTAFKKLCRRFKIAKWPHRQLRGLDKKIAALKAELNYSTGDRDACNRCLAALQEEKLRISRTPAANKTASKDTPAPAHTHAHTHVSDWLASGSSTHSGVGEEEDGVAGAVKEAVERSLRGSPGVSPLDLLASVAGIKEEHDRALAAYARASSDEGAPRSPTGSLSDVERCRAASVKAEDVAEGEEGCVSRAASVDTLRSSSTARGGESAGEEEEGAAMKISGLIWGSERAPTKFAPLTFPLPSPSASFDTPPLNPLPPMTPPMHAALGASAIPTMAY